MPTKSTSVLTPEQQVRTTLPAKRTAAPARTAPNRAARRSAKSKSETSLIVVNDAKLAQQGQLVAETIVAIGYHEASGEKATDLHVAEMARYRRMFPAKPQHAEKLQAAGFGTDHADLYGASEAYRSAWTKVKNSARDMLTEKLVADGFPRATAEKLAKDKVETDRKNVSVAYRNMIEREVRDQFSNGVDRLAFMLGHGFNYQSNVSGDKCIEHKGSTLTVKDGTAEVTVPGHKVDRAKGTVLADKKVTASNQDGNVGSPSKEAEALVKLYSDALAKHDVVGLLEGVRGMLGTIAKLTVPESIDLATRSIAVVETERALRVVYTHLGITEESYAAARARKPQVAASK